MSGSKPVQSSENELREVEAEVMVSRHSSISNNFRSFVIRGQTNERDSLLRLIQQKLREQVMDNLNIMETGPSGLPRIKLK